MARLIEGRLLPGIASGEPALAPLPDDGALLVYSDAAGYLRMNSLTPLGAWTGDQPVHYATPLGNMPLRAQVGTSPGLGLAAIEGTPAVYGLFTDYANPYSSRLWRFQSSKLPWVATDLLDPGEIHTMSRPAIAWLPGDGAHTGRLYLVYTSGGTGNAATDSPLVLLQMSYATKQPNGTIVPHVGLKSDYSNDWTWAFGVDLLYDARLGHMVEIHALADEDPNRRYALMVFPRGDGILDLAYHDRDDWENLGLYACRSLARWPSVTCR